MKSKCFDWPAGFRLLLVHCIVLLILLALIEGSLAALHYYSEWPRQSRFATLSAFRQIVRRPVHALDELGVDLVRGVYPAYLWNPQLHDPRDGYLLAGPRNAIVSYCHEDEADEKPVIRFRTDDLGFRNGPLRSRYRALVLGDSYVEGACARDASTITGVLSTAGIQTYNLVVAGRAPCSSSPS